MKYREFAKTGFKLSEIGMGTYYDPSWIMFSKLFGVRRNKDRFLDALKIGLDGGINLIDTAEIYGSEPIVAQAIKGRKRDELFIATKVFPMHLSYDSVIKACNKSLKSLDTGYIDLYQIHFPSRRVPIHETMRAMEKLVDEGKIRYIGVSNFSLKQMIEAEEALSKYELSSTQMNYSLNHRNIEADIIPHCKENRISVLAYYPVAHGKLSNSGNWQGDSLSSVLSRNNGKTYAQIALNWLITKNELVFPIPRASNPDHVRENVEVSGWNLSEDDMKTIESQFPV